MTAGELLRAARERHGLTQKQLAIRSRTSQAAISRIERGLVSPTVETLEKLLAMVNEELVLDARPIDWGHDVTLNRGALQRTVAERVANLEPFAEFVRHIRGGGSFRPRALLGVLVEHDVDFVVVGRVAGAARGSAYLAGELDIACVSEPANLERLAAALQSTAKRALGTINVVELPSARYAELHRRSGEALDVDGVAVHFAALDDVIALLEATRRPGDLVVASELRMLADELRDR